MTADQYLILFFITLTLILVAINGLYNVWKLNNQIEELKAENEALRGLRNSIEESLRKRNRSSNS